jgi:RHO1 GDP-GTP exchange protein 1/2
LLLGSDILFHDVLIIFQQCAGHPNVRLLDLEHFLNRPSDHLAKYPILFEALIRETPGENTDATILINAVHSVNSIFTLALLLGFQKAMGSGASGKMEWHDLVSAEARGTIPKHEAKKQKYVKLI